VITIYKYDVPEGGSFELELPPRAQILTVQVQHGRPRIWVLGDTEEKFEVRYFKLIGTGRHYKINPYKIERYIGTFQMEDGTSVFHLFEMHK
jgi:hypothetical protein